MPERIEAPPAPKVLVVEDNPLHVRLVNTMLDEAWPLADAPRVARRLDEALVLLAAEIPDCVLLDLALPDADGLEAVRRVVAAAPGTPVVVLSSHDDAELALRALVEGADDYLVKGDVDVAGLARSIRHAMVRRRRLPVVDLNAVVAVGGDDRGSVVAAVLDTAGVVTSCEEGVVEMLGRPFAELVGAPMRAVVRADDAPTLHDALRRAASRPDGRAVVTLRLVHGSGHGVRVTATVRCLFGSTSEVAGHVVELVPLFEEGTGSSGGTFAVVSGLAG